MGVLVVSMYLNEQNLVFSTKKITSIEYRLLASYVYLYVKEGKLNTPFQREIIDLAKYREIQIIRYRKR